MLSVLLQAHNNTKHNSVWQQDSPLTESSGEQRPLMACSLLLSLHWSSGSSNLKNAANKGHLCFLLFRVWRLVYMRTASYAKRLSFQRRAQLKNIAAAKRESSHFCLNTGVRVTDVRVWCPRPSGCHSISATVQGFSTMTHSDPQPNNISMFTHTRFMNVQM